MKTVKRLVFFLNTLVVIITLLSYLSPITDPSKLWPISVLAVFYPLWLILNLLFVLYWFSTKFKYSLLSLLTIALGYIPLQHFIGFHSQSFRSHANQVEIVSYNIENLHHVFKFPENRKERSKEFFSFMEDFRETDILCLQEVGPRSIAELEKKFNFPHKMNPEIVGPMILSKHPIVQQGRIHSSTNTVNSCIWADINIKGNTFRVYNVHMQSNNITRTAEKVIDEPNIQSKETWNNIKSIIARYKDNASFRIEHAERIKDHILESPYPVILAGDFNDVPQSYMFHILSSRMQDSFMKQGTGLGITFAGKIPALRIDYILTDQKFKILNHKIIKDGYSDHFPIKSTIILKEAG